MPDDETLRPGTVTPAAEELTAKCEHERLPVLPSSNCSS